MSRLNVIACNCKDQVWLSWKSWLLFSIDWIMNSKFWKADKNMKDRLNLKSKSVMLNVFSYKSCTKESKIGNANSLSPAWVRMKMKDVSYDTLCTNNMNCLYFGKMQSKKQEPFLNFSQLLIILKLLF